MDNKENSDLKITFKLPDLPIQNQKNNTSTTIENTHTEIPLKKTSKKNGKSRKKSKS